MDVLEYCQSHHMSDEENDLDLHIRRCRYCRKAMCETCFDVHKNHCSGEAQSSKRKGNVSYSSSAGPTVKKCKVSTNSKQSGASISSPLESLSSNLMQGTLQAFPQCAVHSVLEDQFCVSHCTLVCKTCQTDRHKSCTVKSVSEVCGDLDHTTVTQYKKWLNNLRVSGIELKTRLRRNLENAEKQKIKALNELQSSFTKANENLNNAYLNVKSEIENTSDSYFTETRKTIERLEEINDTLESSLKDSGTIEGYRMNTKLMLKLLDTISRHNIYSLPVELSTLSSDLKKVNYSFIANMRYQALSPRSSIGQINTIITKMTPIKHATIAELSHIFSKVSNNGNSFAETRTDTLSPIATSSTEKAIKADETGESVPVIIDSWKTYSDTVRKDFTAKATGQYVVGYTKNIAGQKCGKKDIDGDKHANVNGNQTVNAITEDMVQLSGKLRTEHENIDTMVSCSNSSQQHTRATNKGMKDQPEQNKNNVVLLHDSPYVLVPYIPLKAKNGKHYVAKGEINTHGSNFPSCNAIADKGKVSNTDKYKPQQSSQSVEQSRSHVQIYHTGHTVAQTASLSEITIGNADSDKLDSCVHTLKMKTGVNGLKSKSIANKCGQPRSETVTTDASVNEIRPAPLTTASSYLQNSILCYNNALNDRGAINDQMSHFPLYANPMSRESKDLERCMVSTLPSTETGKKKENNNFNALLQAAEMDAHSSHASENSANMNLTRGTNSNNTIVTQLHTNTSKADNDMPQNIITYNNIVSPLHTMGTVATTNLQMESYINNSNLTCLPNMDNVTTLPVSDRTLANVENSATATTPMNDTIKKKQNNKLVFTGLNVTSVSKKKIGTADRTQPYITGCIVMPDDRIILCDWNNKNLKLLDRMFTIQCSLDLPSEPLDISAVDDTTAIMTVPDMKQLQYVNVTDRLTLGGVIQLDMRCWGVHVVDSSIYVTCYNSYLSTDCEIRILDLNGKFRKRLNLSIFERPYCIKVSTRTKRIYVSNWFKHTVTCMDPDGTVVYQYKDPELRGPRGLCVDDEDNVIVCGCNSDNIHIVTSAGERSSIILTGDDGIYGPRFVAYRRSDNTLIVGSESYENLYVIQCSEK